MNDKQEAQEFVDAKSEVMMMDAIMGAARACVLLPASSRSLELPPKAVTSEESSHEKSSHATVDGPLRNTRTSCSTRAALSHHYPSLLSTLSPKVYSYISMCI